MDNINIMETENKQDRINELFKDTVSVEVYDRWADTFEIESVGEKQVIISYDGIEEIKLFKKECQKALSFCVYSFFGLGKKIKFVKKSHRNTLSPKTKKNIKAVKFFAIGMIFVCIATSIIIMLFSYIGNRNFRETFYITSNIKIDSRVRVIQLSDLHSCSYGQSNKKLLQRIEALKPDIIICTGDMVNSAKEDEAFAIDLASKLSKIAPSYYVYGNNEVESIYGFPFSEKVLDEKFGFNKENRDQNALLNLEDSFEDKLEEAGMKVLKNEKDTIKVRTMTVDVYGILNSNPSSFWSYSENAFLNYINENTDNLKITAVHEPFIFEEFSPDFWGDLMVCGHTHGGVVRVPILGPLFTNEGGLLPERNGDFVYGRYNVAGSPLIVSSGLENSNILRINNQPELVIIDINKF